MLAAASHTNVAMTMRYIDSAAVLRSLSPRRWQPNWSCPDCPASGGKLSIFPFSLGKYGVTPTGIEPVLPT